MVRALLEGPGPRPHCGVSAERQICKQERPAADRHTSRIAMKQRGFDVRSVAASPQDGLSPVPRQKGGTPPPRHGDEPKTPKTRASSQRRAAPPLPQPYQGAVRSGCKTSGQETSAGAAGSTDALGAAATVAAKGSVARGVVAAVEPAPAERCAPTACAYATRAAELRSMASAWRSSAAVRAAYSSGDTPVAAAASLTTGATGGTRGGGATTCGTPAPTGGPAAAAFAFATGAGGGAAGRLRTCHGLSAPPSPAQPKQRVKPPLASGQRSARAACGPPTRLQHCCACAHDAPPAHLQRRPPRGVRATAIKATGTRRERTPQCAIEPKSSNPASTYDPSARHQHTNPPCCKSVLCSNIPLRERPCGTR